MEVYGVIYKLTNKINSKIYIGQTIRDINLRIKEHKNPTSRSKNTAIGRAVIKYGWNNFSFEIVYVIFKSCKNKQKELNKAEKELIKTFNTFESKSGYNCNTGGIVGGKHDKEAIKKIQKSSLGRKLPKTKEHRDKIRKTLTGSKIPENVRKKISKSLTGIRRTPEQRERYRQAALKRSQNPEYIEKIRKTSIERKSWLKNGKSINCKENRLK